MESPDGAVHDGRVTAPSAPARASLHRRFRLVVVVASVVAAIVGSVLLADHRSSQKVDAPTAHALPPGGTVVARIRIGHANATLGQDGGGPLAAGDGAVWLSNPSYNTVTRIDPATNRVVKTVQVGFQPCGFLAADATDVWVTPAGCGGGNAPGTATNVVARVDSRTNEVTSRLADADPGGIVAAFGTVWVATGAANVDQIGPHSGRLVARLHVGGEPERVGVGFGSVWVNDDFGRVLRIRPQR